MALAEFGEGIAEATGRQAGPFLGEPSTAAVLRSRAIARVVVDAERHDLVRNIGAARRSR